MAKFLTIDPSQITAAKRTRIQETIYQQFKTDINLPDKADPSDITAEDIELYLKRHLKGLVYRHESAKNKNDFITNYSELNL